MNNSRTKKNTMSAAFLATVLLLGSTHTAFAATTFTRDLALGASGNDVTALQQMLIKENFSIPSGPTGYFGAQTKAALASYQAAHNIVPAAGYFGPTTRASVNASGDTGTDTNGTTTPPTGTLSGGEATLRSFDLVSGNDLDEGDTNQEIAVAEFDVKGGDVRVQRITLEVTGDNASLSTQPWRYLDTLAVYNGSKKVGSIDVGSKNDWDKDGTTYVVDIPVDTIIKAGKSAELSIRADAQSSIDSGNLNQTFSLIIPKNGIRVIDGERIQHYVGSDTDIVRVGFNGEDSGKLSLREASDNPEAGVIVADNRDMSDKADVLAFEVRNANDAEVDLTDLTVRVNAEFAGSSVAGEDVDNIIRRATLELDGKTYQGKMQNADSGAYEGSIVFKNLKTSVAGDDTIDGVITVELYGSDNRYDSGAILTFDLLSADVKAEGNRSGDDSEVTGSVLGNEMTVTTESGISLSGRSTAAVVTTPSSGTTPSFGTYTLRFDVTAVGDDVFIPRSVAVDGAATTTAGVRVVNISTPYVGSVSTLITSSAKQYNNDFFVVREGDTKTFTVNVVLLDPQTVGYYQLGIDFVQFSSTGSDVNTLQKLEVDQNKQSFSTDPIYIPE
jgi:peptidoglycan hydrolase-like protein with peptidoglycan-binding domain